MNALKNIALLLTAAQLGACVALLQPTNEEMVPVLAQVGGDPAATILAQGADDPGVIADWSVFVPSPELKSLVAEALSNNPDLQATRARWLAAVAQSEAVAGSRWPSLSAELEQSRQGNDSQGTSVITDTGRVALGFRWELDLWGGVALGTKSALYNALRQEELYGWSQYSLAAAISRVWLDAIDAQQQWQLAQAREENLKSNLDIIQDGFYSGIRDALDVYTARAEFANSQSNTLLREQAFLAQQRQLQTLLGRYPNADISLPSSSPTLTDPVVAGVPLKLLARRPDIRASANALIAQQANLGIATINRLPALTLRGSYGRTGGSASDALNGDDIFWNAIGGLTAPLFQGGSLAAEQRRQKALLEAALADYRSIVLGAMNEVEQTLDNQRLLREQLAAATRANNVSKVAEEQAFESYIAGISNLNTWLLAQRTAFNRNGELVRLKTSVQKNRIELYLALAGDFGTSPE